MKTLRQIRMAAAGMVAVAAVQMMAQTAPLPVQAGAQARPQAAAPTHTRVIVVSLEDRKLALVEDGQVKEVYTVAVGKPSTPSPVGTFTIARRVRNPTYSHDGRVVAAGPNNPVGTRWMGLSIRGYGIHGTNAPRSIGKAASHGCIRMARADLEALYAQVHVGDTVELIGQGDEQTAQLFGTGAAQPAADMQLAAATGATQPAAPAVHEAVAANTPAVTGAL
jgi:lipoprotein-anchoring transpeptidase ErfK/SrfK